MMRRSVVFTFIPPHPLILNMRYGIRGMTPSKMKNPGTEMKIFTSNDIEEILQSSEATKWEKIYSDMENFQHDLASLDQVELRLGRTKLNAIRVEFDGSYRALLEQKQVDMLMGLDIQRIAFKKIADRILIFSKDTDLIPCTQISQR